MSKLAFIRRYNYAPAAGGLLGDLWNIGKGLFGKKTKAPTAPFTAPGFPVASPYTLPYTSPATGAKRLMNGGGGGGGVRRGKGISARELRGFRKVSRLLHREGMVPKRTRKGKGLWA